jgi:hypothetical protein
MGVDTNLWRFHVSNLSNTLSLASFAKWHFTKILFYLNSLFYIKALKAKTMDVWESSFCYNTSNSRKVVGRNSTPLAFPKIL